MLLHRTASARDFKIQKYKFSFFSHYVTFSLTFSFRLAINVEDKKLFRNNENEFHGLETEMFIACMIIKRKSESEKEFEVNLSESKTQRISEMVLSTSY